MQFKTTYSKLHNKHPYSPSESLHDFFFLIIDPSLLFNYWDNLLHIFVEKQI